MDRVFHTPKQNFKYVAITSSSVNSNKQTNKSVSFNIQWVPLNVIPQVQAKIMTLSRLLYYPGYSTGTELVTH